MKPHIYRVSYRCLKDIFLHLELDGYSVGKCYGTNCDLIYTKMLAIMDDLSDYFKMNGQNRDSCCT